MTRSLSSFLLGGAVRRECEKWRVRGKNDANRYAGELAGQAYVRQTR